MAAPTIYPTGAQIVSPANTPGQISYLASPQASLVNCNGGTTTLSSGAATVVNTNVTANSIVLFTLKTPSGTIAGGPTCATITPGTGFTVSAGGSDNSTYNYLIIG